MPELDEDVAEWGVEVGGVAGGTGCFCDCELPVAGQGGIDELHGADGEVRHAIAGAFGEADDGRRRKHADVGAGLVCIGVVTCVVGKVGDEVLGSDAVVDGAVKNGGIAVGACLLQVLGVGRDVGADVDVGVKVEDG